MCDWINFIHYISENKVDLFMLYYVTVFIVNLLHI